MVHICSHDFFIYWQSLVFSFFFFGFAYNNIMQRVHLCFHIYFFLIYSMESFALKYVDIKFLEYYQLLLLYARM